MFRFWSSESRGCANTTELLQTEQSHQPYGAHNSGSIAHDSNAMPAATAASAKGTSTPTLKRKSPTDDGSIMPPSPTTELDPPFDSALSSPPQKRLKSETDMEASWPRSAYCASFSASQGFERCASPPTPPLSVALACQDGPSMEEVTDIVQYQFSHEILLKHSELRLIEQEMAKCQIAMEQMRRCHLIPYPTTCPTPQQMLDISSGRGPPVRTRPGASVPKWSAPFGVTDGPYARHYAKWLIPDPVFDGVSSTLVAPTSVSQQSRSRSAVSADIRSTRNNSCAVPDTTKGRPTRTSAGQKLQALANAYPPARSRAGPCVLKRSDGQVVKLVCVDCNRDDFSSTQGFINHCRIAHKREYKSHDVAAMHCGQPLDSDDPAPLPAAAPPKTRNVVAAPTRTSISSSISTTASTPAAPGHVHQLARTDNTDTEALLKRMESSNKVYCHAARGAARAARSQSRTSASSSFVGSLDTPFLSKFLEQKQFSGDIDASVNDAKAPSGLEHVDWDTLAEKEAVSSLATSSTPARSKATKATKTTVAAAAIKRAPAGSRPVQSLASATSFDGTAENAASPEGLFDDDMEVDLSPILRAANNAPSLVSDDGEFDDSDDEGSDSDAADMDMDLGSASDVPEYNSDENEDEASRPLRHHRGGVKLRRDGAKHVTFVSPVKGSNKGKHD
ncbi:spindle poly body spacer protein spc110 [Ophiostoma piceae UAMH 11346]|uniref:Spindle poly body spacer protein spc110 n=1 Tax=Ophiostoma piceae (strain UAMH 11346) TaxID=1262450 RepID=S3C3R8_OPHP1|nr:spindle poly body spacer protein spc110 [Ophiostoma piceae UAMH 11346]